MISIICWQTVYISKTVAIFMTDPVSGQKSGKGGGEGGGGKTTNQSQGSGF